MFTYAQHLLRAMWTHKDKFGVPGTTLPDPRFTEAMCLANLLGCATEELSCHARCLHKFINEIDAFSCEDAVKRDQYVRAVHAEQDGKEYGPRNLLPIAVGRRLYEPNRAPRGNDMLDGEVLEKDWGLCPFYMCIPTGATNTQLDYPSPPHEGSTPEGCTFPPAPTIQEDAVGIPDHPDERPKPDEDYYARVKSKAEPMEEEEDDSQGFGVSDVTELAAKEHVVPKQPLHPPPGFSKNLMNKRGREVLEAKAQGITLPELHNRQRLRSSALTSASIAKTAAHGPFRSAWRGFQLPSNVKEEPEEDDKMIDEDDDEIAKVTAAMARLPGAASPSEEGEQQQSGHSAKRAKRDNPKVHYGKGNKGK